MYGSPSLLVLCQEWLGHLVTPWSCTPCRRALTPVLLPVTGRREENLSVEVLRVALAPHNLSRDASSLGQPKLPCTGRLWGPLSPGEVEYGH